MQMFKKAKHKDLFLLPVTVVMKPTTINFLPCCIPFSTWTSISCMTVSIAAILAGVHVLVADGLPSAPAVIACLMHFLQSPGRHHIFPKP